MLPGLLHAACVDLAGSRLDLVLSWAQRGPPLVIGKTLSEYEPLLVPPDEGVRIAHVWSRGQRDHGSRGSMMFTPRRAEDQHGHAFYCSWEGRPPPLNLCGISGDNLMRPTTHSNNATWADIELSMWYGQRSGPRWRMHFIITDKYAFMAEPEDVESLQEVALLRAKLLNHVLGKWKSDGPVRGMITDAYCEHCGARVTVIQYGFDGLPTFHGPAVLTKCAAH